jgi:hypothetical protein
VSKKLIVLASGDVGAKIMADLTNAGIEMELLEEYEIEPLPLVALPPMPEIQIVEPKGQQKRNRNISRWRQ